MCWWLTSPASSVHSPEVTLCCFCLLCGYPFHTGLHVSVPYMLSSNMSGHFYGMSLPCRNHTSMSQPGSHLRFSCVLQEFPFYTCTCGRVGENTPWYGGLMVWLHKSLQGLWPHSSFASSPCRVFPGRYVPPSYPLSIPGVSLEKKNPTRFPTPDWCSSPVPLPVNHPQPRFGSGPGCLGWVGISIPCAVANLQFFPPIVWWVNCSLLLGSCPCCHGHELLQTGEKGSLHAHTGAHWSSS